MNEKTSAGPGAVADDLAVRADLPGRRRADRAEDAGADHRADRQHDQIAGAEHALQAAFALRQQLGDGFSSEEVEHQVRSVTARQSR